MVRSQMVGMWRGHAREDARDGALDAAPEQARSKAGPGRPTLLVLLALGLVALTSLILQVWGILGDLPYPPDGDEPVYLQAVVRMLQHRTLDPGWFSHPGSTVLYPVAALVELWYQFAHHVPPFAHAMPGIGREFVANPTPFYAIGRLVSAAYGVGCIGATWLLARHIVGDVGGVLATLLLLATSIVVAYGQIVRDDIAGMFFALIALWLAIRAMEVGRLRDWVLAAAAIGLAIATRYFFATLIVPYGLAAWLWLRSSPARPTIRGRSRAAWSVPLIALLATPAAFFVTSPVVLLDLRQVVHQLRSEAGGVHPGADGLSSVGNLGWYVGQVIPGAFSPGILLLAIFGVVVAARWNGRATAVLGAFVATYLAGVSSSPLHWDRYIIPLVPIVGIFASAAALAIGDAVARGVLAWRARRRPALPSPEPMVDARGRHRPLAVGLAAVMLVVLLVPHVLTVAAADRLRSVPSTRALATDWVLANLPPTTRIAEEPYTTYADGTGRDLLRLATVADRSLAEYRAGGYRYVITSTSVADRFRDPLRYPKESAFYKSLAGTGHLVATFEPGPDRAGPTIRVYEIATP